MLDPEGESSTSTTDSGNERGNQANARVGTNENDQTNANKREEKGKEKSCWKKTKAWVMDWHLPLLLVFALFIGFVAPTPGEKADNTDLGGVCFSEDTCVWDSIGSLCVTLIFFMSGLKLKTDAIKKALGAWKATLFGVTMILFISPCLSFAVVTANFAVTEFALGLALFFAMPTTLSSGPIIAGQAKGNVALALMLTVITNVVGVFTSPLFVTKFIDIFVSLEAERVDGDSQVDISLDPVPLILKLTFTILVPLFIGKVLADLFESVRKLTKRFGKEMKIFSSVLLALIPWMKVSSSADSFKQIDAASFVLMWLVGIALHLFLLVLNYFTCRYMLRLPLDEECSVVIVASQKTLPVALTILDFFPPSIGAPGLIAIPIIVSHLMQILIDSVVASKYALAANRLEEAAVSAENDKRQQPASA